MDLTDEQEEAARLLASEAYHDHPSHPSDCRVRIEERLDPEGSRCPCEDRWRDFINEQ
jgi:hypothetical protein